MVSGEMSGNGVRYLLARKVSGRERWGDEKGVRYLFLPVAEDPSGSNYATSYGYDSLDNLTSEKRYLTPFSLTPFPPLKRLTGILDYAGNNLGFSYDALGRRTSLARPNGVNTSYSYDTLSRLLGVVHQAGAITVDGALYTYDAAGNRTAKTVLPSGPAYNYSYDPIYQLTQALRTTDNTITESYTYDTVGNRLTALNTPYTYNSSNEMLTLQGTSYTYDANGNRLSKTNSTGTTSYTWDYENRLTSATLPGTGGTVYFTYDPFGRRVQKISPTAGTTIYTYDGANEVSQLTATGGLQVRFTQGLGIDEPLVELRPTRTVFTEADGVGTVTSHTNPNGNLVDTFTFDSFGWVDAGFDPATDWYLYTGREIDTETALYYYRARYYDPQAGRFLSEDPAGLAGGINRYAYVHGNALRYVDPFGLLDYDTTVIFGSVHIHVDDSLPLSQQFQLAENLNAAIYDINWSGVPLNQAIVLMDLTAISVDSSALRSYTNEPTGVFTLTPGYVEASSTPWLASAIAHDAYHVEEYLECQQSRGLNAERNAMQFQLAVGQNLGLSNDEISYLQSLIDDVSQLQDYIQSPVRK